MQICYDLYSGIVNYGKIYMSESNFYASRFQLEIS